MKTESRQTIITRTAVIGIAVNLLVAAVKILIGVSAASLAIISEGINNASDAASSFLTLAGTKLSEKHADEKHPFGYGRIEYLTGLVVGILILVTGYDLLKESAVGILHPGEMSVTLLAIGIVAFSAVVKFFLGMYTIRMGRKTQSDALIAVGEDCRNDSFFSILTIGSGLLFLKTGKSMDAIAGLVFSLVILKSGLDTLSSTVSELIGRPGERELATKLYKEIRSTEGVISAADMMLHNYGPEHFSGSVNIEVDHKKTVGEIYEVIHALQLRIMQEYNVTMVFGMYAVDRDSLTSRQMRKYIADFVKQYPHVKSFHALYQSPDQGKIYCDFIVDYEQDNWQQLEASFHAYMAQQYPENTVILTIETEFV